MTKTSGLVDGSPPGTSGRSDETTTDDFVRKLYPFVDESKTPVPRGWSTTDKDQHLGVAHNKLKLTYRGLGKTHKDAAAVRTPHPIPATCGLYYYEVKILSKGRDGYMGIGLCQRAVNMNRLPGWDQSSYGYHGDDGNFFCSSGSGVNYGPTFTTGDIIGCGYNMVDNTLFYTKNGQHLGVAQYDLPSNLYPTVGLQTPGEAIDTNFGQTPFVYNIYEDIMEARVRVRASIAEHQLSATKTEWFTKLVGSNCRILWGETTENVVVAFCRLISSYLVHQGYCATAESFTAATDQRPVQDILAMKTRQRIGKMILRGHISDAIYSVSQQYPTLLERNPQLLFLLKCRQFVEMIAGVDNEARRGARSVSTSTASTSPPQRASAPYTTRTRHCPRDYGSGGRRRKSPRTSVIRNAAAAQGSGSDDEAVSTHNGVQNGSSAAPAGEDQMDYQESNGTTTNGAAADLHSPDDSPPAELSNGSAAAAAASSSGSSAPSSTAAATVVVPRVGNCENVDKLLEFGRELTRLAKQLPAKSKYTPKLKKKMEEAFVLLAYPDPWQSVHSQLLQPKERQAIATALNSAILESQGSSARPPIDLLIGHSAQLRHTLAEHGFGAAAFMAPADLYLNSKPSNAAPAVDKEIDGDR